MSTAIEIHEITKTYPPQGKQPALTAVDRVSLSIQPGELFFLLGPSGCGKTTLLRMIAGFIEPTAGQIIFNGRDVTNTDPNKRNTGMVFQSYALWPHMTVAANVGFGLKIRNTPAGEAASRVREALETVQMHEQHERKPNQLSGGQQQRVALARAIVVRPDVLLLDEPLSNLDAKLRNELRDEIRRVCKAVGITTVYVTHDQREALTMADRLAVFRSGKVVQVGTPEELYQQPISSFVAAFIGETNLIPVIEASRIQNSHRVTTAIGVIECSCSFSPTALSIRPEFVTVDDDGAPNATLLSIDYLGSHCVARVSMNGVTLLGIAPTRMRSASIGTHCRVTVSHVGGSPVAE